MVLVSRVLLVILINIFAYCCARSNEYMLDEDRPYEDIKISIPHALWKQAVNPTPVLKSPVTVVVPVYVPPEDNDDYVNNDVDNEVVTEIVATEEQVVQDVVANDPVVGANDTALSPVADAPVASVPEDVVDVVSTPVPPVTGSLTRFPCSCVKGQCGCCTGAFLQRFQTKACGNITFIAEDFLFDVRLSVNNQTVVRRRVSASDPPPICFNPRRAPFVTVCAEISNIRIRNRNAFACLDINADIGGFPVYSAPFRCFGLGASGVQSGLKPKPPKTSGPAPVSLFGSGTNDDDDDDDGILGIGGDGFFGGGSDDAGGPFDEIGDVVGDFFDGRSANLS